MYIFTSCTKQDKVNIKINSSNNAAQTNSRKDKYTIRVCQSEQAPESLDPISLDNKLHEITFHIFDRLVKWNDHGEIEKDLIDDYKILDDNKTYQFKLKKGVKFHNGEEFNAESVKFTFDRLINPGSESSKHSLFISIKKVTIIDPYTIEIETHNPDYLFLRKLALVQIIPNNYYKEVGPKLFGKNPIGTSAYKFKKRMNDGSIVLTRNENYWNKNKPIIKTIIFKFIESDKMSRKELIDALFKGEVDLITEIPGIHSLKLSKNPKTKVIKMTNQAKVHKMLFNSLKTPFSSLEVRKAVNLALNRDVLIKVLAKGNGKKIATSSVKLEFGHNPELKPYPYDLEQAKKIIKKSGLENTKIKIAVTKEAEYIAKAVQKDLERIKLKSEIITMTVNEMAKQLIQSNSKAKYEWDYDLTIYTGVNPFMHVGFIYGVAIYSNGSWSKTRNKEFDELYEKLKTTLKKDNQKEICYKLEKLAYDNYWYTPIFQVIGTYGAAKDLHLNDSATSFVDLKEAYFKN